MVDNLLREILIALDCTRMVVGHTPQDEVNCVSIPALGRNHVSIGSPNNEGISGADSIAKVVRTYDVWRIDTGISEGIGGGVAEVLEIRTEGRVVVLDEAGTPIPSHRRTVCVRSDT
jgi:hypothetical protein